MNEPTMEEAALREMLERATAVEPPIGPVARNAVRAGVKRRRRRRVAGAAAVLAVAAAVFLTVPAVTGTRSTPAPATGTIPATVWVANYRGQESVTPISTTTNQAGTPIGPREHRRHRLPGGHAQREDGLPSRSVQTG